MKAWILAVALASPLGSHAQVLGGSASMGGTAKLSASGSAVTVTHIQGCASQMGSSGTSVTCTFASAVGAGHLLVPSVVNVNQSASNPTYSFSGDSGTFTPVLQNFVYALGASACNSSYGCSLNSWYVLSASGGETSITISAPSFLLYTGFAIDEFSCSPACTFDTADTGNSGTGGTTANSIVSGSITPATSGELIVGVLASSYPNSALSSGTAYTMGAFSTLPNGNEYFTQTTAAAVTATGSTASAAPWAAAVMAFRP